MKLIKKIVVCLVIASLFLGMIVSYASAQGPTGAPPTQNVSPTFSDVNVKGSIITDGYIKATKQGAPAELNLPATVAYILKAQFPVVIKGALIATTNIVAQGPSFFTSINADSVQAPILLVNNIASAFYEIGDEDADLTDGVPVTVTDESGLVVKKGLTVGENLSVTGDLDVEYIKPVGDFILMVNTLNHIFLGNPFGPGDQLWLAAKQIFTSGNVTVIGHLKATSIGEFTKTESKIYKFVPNNDNEQQTAVCPADTQIVSCGFGFYSDLNDTEYQGMGVGVNGMTVHPADNACVGHFFNASGSNKWVKMYPVCFDTDAS